MKLKSKRNIPKPTGPYSVGCTDVMTEYSPSGVFVRLFYPAVSTENAKSPDWLPHESYLQGYGMYFKIWPPLFCKTFPKFVGEVQVPAGWDALPLTSGQRPFPIIVFSHGLGGCRTSYTTYCLEMASQGFVVAALEHRDYSACMSFFYEKKDSALRDCGAAVGQQTETTDTSLLPEEELVRRWMLFKKVKQGKGEYPIRNQQVHQRAGECSAALDLLLDMNASGRVANVLRTSALPPDAFLGLLDPDRAFVAGHSFGGATAVTALAKDKRFKAGFGLDTWMLPLREEKVLLEKVLQPLLFINMERFQTRSNLKIMKRLESPKLNHLVITLKGTVHLNQCDVPFLCDKTMRRLFGAHSHLNRFTAMKLTTRLSTVFLGQHFNVPVNESHEEYISQHKEVMIKGIRV